MASTPKVYVLCDANCKWEGMTKEQILTAITQAVNDGTISNIDTGFVQTVKTINGTALKFFVGEQSEYDALTEEQKENLFAIITNDTTKEGLLAAMGTLQTNLNELETKLKKGTIMVGSANLATSATYATKAYNLVNDPFPTPSRKTSLPTVSTVYGYYYVSATTSLNGVVNFGIFYWSGKATIIGEVYCGNANSAYRLEIVANGKFNLYRAQTQADGSIGTYEDVTSSATLNVARIGIT